MLGRLDLKWKHERMIVGVGTFVLYSFGGLYAVLEPRPPYLAGVYILISGITFALMRVQKVILQRCIQELNAEINRLREQEVFR